MGKLCPIHGCIGRRCAVRVGLEGWPASPPTPVADGEGMGVCLERGEGGGEVESSVHKHGEPHGPGARLCAVVSAGCILATCPPTLPPSEQGRALPLAPWAKDALVGARRGTKTKGPRRGTKTPPPAWLIGCTKSVDGGTGVTGAADRYTGQPHRKSIATSSMIDLLAG